MSWSQRLISAAAIAIIFGSGFFAAKQLSQPDAVAAIAPNRQRRIMSHNERLAYMNEHFNLSQAQQTQLLEQFEVWQKDRRSLEIEIAMMRRDVFLQHAPPLREILNPSDRAKFDQLVATTRKKHEQQLNRKTLLFHQDYGS